MNNAKGDICAETKKTQNSTFFKYFSVSPPKKTMLTFVGKEKQTTINGSLHRITKTMERENSLKNKAFFFPFFISPPQLHLLLTKTKTYKKVCHTFYIGLLKLKTKTATILNSVYVRLCYVISYLNLSIYLYLLKSLYKNLCMSHKLCYVILEG